MNSGQVLIIGFLLLWFVATGRANALADLIWGGGERTAGQSNATGTLR